MPNLNQKKYLLYADGGGKKGLGHLSRLTTLSKKINIFQDSTFLFDNAEQKKFYDLSSINALDINNFTNEKNQYLLLFVDTKLNRMDIFELLNSCAKFSVLIDNDTSFQKLFDYSINPSFYAPKKNFGSLKESTIYLSGVDYSIVREEFISYPDHLNSNNSDLKFCTLSFGGVDPNNITLLLTKVFSKYKWLKDDLKIILGPGYSHDINLLLELVSADQIIQNPENMNEYFLSSYFVITALGVTIQELFSMGASTGLITNYEEDLKDIQNIRHFSKELHHSQSSNQISFYGHYKNIQVTKLLNDIERLKSEKNPQQPYLGIGRGWDSFLSDISSI